MISGVYEEEDPINGTKNVFRKVIQQNFKMRN